jgi:hypothetical protein
VRGDRRCPYCGKAIDAHDGVEPAAQPDVGDVTFCHHCRRVGVFTAAPGGGLVVRQASTAEQAQFRVHPELAALLATYQAAAPLTDADELTPDELIRRWQVRLALVHLDRAVTARLRRVRDVN